MIVFKAINLTGDASKNMGAMANYSSLDTSLLGVFPHYQGNADKAVPNRVYAHN
jgi:hypothetical protein